MNTQFLLLLFFLLSFFLKKVICNGNGVGDQDLRI